MMAKSHSIEGGSNGFATTDSVTTKDCVLEAGVRRQHPVRAAYRSSGWFEAGDVEVLGLRRRGLPARSRGATLPPAVGVLLIAARMPASRHTQSEGVPWRS